MAEEKAKIMFYPLDIDYDSQGVVSLFGRNVNGRKVIVRDAGFKFYCYVIGKGLKEVKKKLDYIELADENYKVLKTEECRMNFFDNPVDALKVYVNHPAAIRHIREEFDGLEIKEADIGLGKKYLIDKNIAPLSLCCAEGYLSRVKGVEVIEHAKVWAAEEKFIDNLKLLSIDIEVYGFTGSFERVNEPIITMGLRGDDFERVLTWKEFKDKPDFVEVLENESGMIKRFIGLIKEYKPDYIIGYYSDGFDFPYLKARADNLGIKLDLGLDGSLLKVKYGAGGKSRIIGIPHIDVCKFVKTTMDESLKLDAYDLDSVAKELLKQGKDGLGLDEIAKCWDNNDLRRLCEYNLKDAWLTLGVFNKIKDNFHELVRLIGVTPFEMCRLSYGQIVEHYLIKMSKEFNELIQSKPMHHEIADRRLNTYQGAFVMEPVPGLYEDVVMLDYRSLYPSIIIAKNISPSTLNKSHGYRTPVIKIGGREAVYFFDDKKKGFIPAIIREIITRRGRVKEILKNEPDNSVLRARSYALKTIANSAYGMFGFFGARYYSRECAESITAFGREYIQKTIEKAREAGFNVVYGDTDSSCLVLENKTINDVHQFLRDSNRELPEFMELELEKYYKRGIFVAKKGKASGAKKKYALIDGNNKLKIVGFETVRKDWSLVAREVQQNVLEMVLKEGGYEHALSYAKDVIAKIKNKEVENKKMVILTQLKREIEDYKQVGPHVAVAKKLRAQGFSVRAGSLIRFIIKEGKGMIRDKAVMPELCMEGEYDAGYYVDNQVVPVIENIFNVFGIDIKQVISGGQKSLGEFYGS